MTWNIGNLNRGKHLSKETKKKISLAKKGNLTWNYGKRWSEETREKISKSRQGQVSWNKGKSWSADERVKRSLAAKRYWKRRKTSHE